MMLATKRLWTRWAGLGRRLSTLTLGLAVVLAMGGCTQMERLQGMMIKTGPKINFDSGPKLPPAQLPRYKVGDSFTYDDGRTETVIAVNGDTITWRNDKGVVRTGYRNFLIPYLAWQNSTRRMHAKTDAAPDILWPLVVGNDDSFHVKRTVERNDGTSKNEYLQNWRCVVEGTQVVTVPAGTFDTYKISCFRTVSMDFYWRQTLTYYFAPEVGHYVLRKNVSKSRASRRRALVSHGIKTAALSDRDRTAVGGKGHGASQTGDGNR